MRQTILILCTLISLSCKKDSGAVGEVVSSCVFESTVTVQTEVPVPVYSLTLEYDGCEQSVALFRENLNFSGSIEASLSSDTTNVTLTFVNSTGPANYPDQGFALFQTHEDREFLVGTGVIRDSIARITSYGPHDAIFYFRNFDKNGWLSTYETSADGFCSTSSNTISTNRPPLAETLFDNDSGWGDDVELSYVADLVTGQYEACINGITDYTIQWNVNGEVFHGDTFETILGRAAGIYFISATIFHDGERMTLSHNVIKSVADKTVVRRARIRRPQGNG